MTQESSNSQPATSWPNDQQTSIGGFVSWKERLAGNEEVSPSVWRPSATRPSTRGPVHDDGQTRERNFVMLGSCSSLHFTSTRFTSWFFETSRQINPSLYTMAVQPSSSSSVARATFELNNDMVTLDPAKDSIFHHNEQEQKEILKQRPWKDE